jgi:hypothetical protein
MDGKAVVHILPTAPCRRIPPPPAALFIVCILLRAVYSVLRVVNTTIFVKKQINSVVLAFVHYYVEPIHVSYILGHHQVNHIRRQHSLLKCFRNMDP